MVSYDRDTEGVFFRGISNSTLSLQHGLVRPIFVMCVSWFSDRCVALLSIEILGVVAVIGCVVGVFGKGKHAHVLERYGFVYP